MADQREVASPASADAVTQANVEVLGHAPAQALGSMYQYISQSLGLAAGNGVNLQNQSNIAHQATTTQGLVSLYSLPAPPRARTTKAAPRPSLWDLFL